MAVLVNTHTKDNISLLAHHTLGRGIGCSTVLKEAPEISRVHAEIFWSGEFWHLKDCSTNGTIINNVRVSPEVNARLKEGDVINFGGNSKHNWRLLDVTEPKTMLIAITPGLKDVEVKDIMALPSESLPEVTVYMSNGLWICETQFGSSVLKSGDIVGGQDSQWRFIEAKSNMQTKALDKEKFTFVRNIESIFNVSQNEEHVSLYFRLNDLQIDLGQRSHHYLLLLLARKRIKDKEAELADSEQGWLDKGLLSKMAGLEESHINIQIYRFRKQLMKALPNYLELPKVIEKRSGEIRIACNSIDINGRFYPSNSCEKSNAQVH